MKEAVYDSKIASYPNLASLYPRFTDKPEPYKQLVIDLMTSMNSGMLEAAEVRSTDLLKAIETSAAKYGASWEDVWI